ncbi:MAG: 2-dehydropantoate 2-reductase [Bdellovibrionales bacterium]|nr:2-dehydropantoate 2-reductase [Bdellovibrionales bacterium]
MTNVNEPTLTRKTKHLVIGPGAIGLSLGSYLATCVPNDNILILGRETRTRQLIISLVGDRSSTSPPLTYERLYDLKSIPNGSYLWVCVKAYNLDALLNFLTDKLNSTHTLMLCMNGLGMAMQASLFIKRTVPTIRSLFSYGALKEADTTIRVSGVPRVLLAGYAEQSETLLIIESLLTQSGFSTEISKNIATAEWEKAMMNIVVNSLATLAGRENGILLSDPDIHAQAKELLTEIRSVAQAEGFDTSHMSDNRFFQKLENFRDNKNSTLIDVEHGRETELPYLLGRFLQIANNYGLSTPVAQSIADQVDLLLLPDKNSRFLDITET